MRGRYAREMVMWLAIAAGVLVGVLMSAFSTTVCVPTNVSALGTVGALTVFIVLLRSVYMSAKLELEAEREAHARTRLTLDGMTAILDNVKDDK